MMWGVGRGDLSQHLGQSLNAVLIMFCASMALPYALARDFKTHRRWALRLYLMVSASLFLRAGLFPRSSSITAPSVSTRLHSAARSSRSYLSANPLCPLPFLKFICRTERRGGTPARFTMAAGLSVLTVAMVLEIFASYNGVWLPRVKAAYDSRKSLAETLSATIASSRH